jgi:para-aminobenzoate synthetase component 1
VPCASSAVLEDAFVTRAGDALELHEAEGAFGRIEAWLRERGFFAPGGEELVADLYLGYGLSSTIRRHASPAPPEPCPLPLAACSIRGGEYVVQYDNGDGVLRFGPWQRTWSPREYAPAVGSVRDAISRGDVYQVNLVQHLSATFAGDAGTLAARLAPLHPHNPEPYRGDGWTVVSGSPELFLARRGRRVWTCPIKGTRPAGPGAARELARSAKDAAEHVMIVDLERNDLSRVCEPGSVRWPELMATRALAGVEHMVSTVEGTLRQGVGLAELLGATFPGGSITGAPKIAAVDLIAELEPVGRGASMGALGRVYGNGDLDLALTIRTFAIADGRIHLWVGGGVVWDSDPGAEIAESWVKADPLLDAIGAPRGGDALRASATTTTAASTSPHPAVGAR